MRYGALTLPGYRCAVASTDTSDGHYFDDAPTAPTKRREIELVLPDVFLALTTDSGVFAAGSVDKGTRYLLRAISEVKAPATPPRSILDLGCGYGPIALTMAKRFPDAHVWGVDVNERALGLADENAEANGVDNVTFAKADSIESAQTFDLIVSNPPIRIGKKALHELLSTWLPRLNTDARAWMVVQKHLGSDSLANWLTEHGWATNRFASKAGFRILETHPSDRSEQP